MTVYSIIKLLEDTQGTNDKITILKENSDNDDLKQFFFMALNPHLMFGIKKIPPYIPGVIGELSLEEAMAELYKFSNRELTGHDAINHLVYILENVSDENADLIERIIKKDPECKVAYKAVNKVWKKCIPVMPYMRCASANEKNYSRITFPAVVQKKANGLFINIILKNGDVELLSRNGKPLMLFGSLDNDVLALGEDSFVMTGEGLVLDDNLHRVDVDSWYAKVLDRKTGNGIINKAIQGTISKEEADRIIIEVWDIVPYEDWVNGKCSSTYDERLGRLKKMNLSNRIRLIESKDVESFDEANIYYKQMLADGEEGAVLKNLSGEWKDHTSPNQVKMKVKDPADLLCVGTYPHKKHDDWIGGLNLESSDRIIKVNTGSGLSHVSDDPDIIPDRLLPPEYYIGKIIELEYNEITDDKKTGQKSLFLPIFKGVRDDKDEADSYELILERSSIKVKNDKIR